MSSILTNQGAMTALRTLKSINEKLTNTQKAISTGKKINSARDNAAIWAISKVMQSDVSSFARISDSLSLGRSTISVARQGAETVADLLTEIKTKIVAAQEENVDREKIQADISALRDQISAVVGAAQFNGLNMLNNREMTAGSGDISVLASLDRSSGGSVTSRHIDVRKMDLSLAASAIGGGLTSLATASNDITGNGDAAAYTLPGAATPATATATFGTASTDAVTAGEGFVIWISGATGDVPGNTPTGHEIRYVARDGDTMADVTAGLAQAFNRWTLDEMGQGNTGSVAAVADGNQITVTGATGASNTFSLRFDKYASDPSSTIGGGLEQLAYLDVTTQSGADSALANIDALIDTAIDAAASFGSAESRLETQQDFITSLSDALKSGIGTMIDADMEEMAAQFQALQVQQQLSVTSLSIANRAPQYLLQLFQ
jgi:flagellin